MEIKTDKINELFLTIDFEDFSFDLRRFLGIKNVSINGENLLRTYLKINNFCKSNLNKQKITFFCTGIIAEQFPYIIDLISRDGHEIACHSLYHDWVNKTPLKKFDYEIAKAIDNLEKASNKKVRGFRAPFFSINEHNYQHYKIIEKYFEYDSSLHINNLNQIRYFKDKLKLESLEVLPVPSINTFFNNYHFKLGGTAFKLLSQKKLNKFIETSINNNIIPIIYLHPYEFFDDLSFYVTKKQMEEVSFIKKHYWLLKQYQWHKLGNKTVLPKLNTIFKIYKSGGSICDIAFKYVKI
tara:strand:- start:107 stop:994 length:888 start_codon:yes stop_codon:yes gene_type:complete